MQNDSKKIVQNIEVRCAHRTPNHAHMSLSDTEDPADDAGIACEGSGTHDR